MKVKIMTKKASSWISSTRGLIGTNERSLFFQTRWGIHTFFLRRPIDVLILDNSYTVKKIKEGLDCNRIFLWNPQWQNVLELPAGTIKRNNIAIGDIIECTYK